MFDSSKMYIFSKSKALDNKSQLYNYMNVESFKSWVDEYENGEVEFISESEGYIGGSIIPFDWCIEL